MVAVIDQVTSSNLSRNTPRRISHFSNDQMASKLMSMGVLPGSQINLIRKAPLGGAWYVRVDNKVIAMRAKEINCIILKD
ncbi:MAG: ferrous iron transport protein A [Saprospiraceae bacterium]|nr:ferrous iron transport protein A [Saprospiraceae bacterium]